MSLLRPTADAESARWLVERLTAFGGDILSIAPRGFEAYARVFHPASRVIYTSDGAATSRSEPLRWSEVAPLTVCTPHRAMQWPSVQGTNPVLNDYTALKVGDIYVTGPEEGSLPVEVARPLWPILEKHTNTRDRCLFAIWEGFGCLPRIVLEAPAFEIPARKFHLFTGPLEAVEETFCTDDVSLARAMSVDVLVVTGPDTPSPEELEEALETYVRPTFPADQQSANLRWPEDRAWCVATEIDFNTTYIAGTQGLVDALVACEAVEVYQIELTDGGAYDGDTLNPTPDDPYGGSFRLE